MQGIGKQFDLLFAQAPGIPPEGSSRFTHLCCGKTANDYGLFQVMLGKKLLD